MTKYREIIRLTGRGFSQRDIMASCGVAQKTVVKVQKRARELKLSWPLDESMTDVYTDQIEHTARRFSAWLPPIQCTLSGHQCMMIIQG